MKKIYEKLLSLTTISLIVLPFYLCPLRYKKPRGTPQRTTQSFMMQRRRYSSFGIFQL